MARNEGKGWELQIHLRVIASTWLRQRPPVLTEIDMRVFLGMILGCLLTVAVVYMHDVSASSTVASSTSGTASQQIVNWEVASATWNGVKDNVRHAWGRLTANVS